MGDPLSGISGEMRNVDDILEEREVNTGIARIHNPPPSDNKNILIPILAGGSSCFMLLIVVILATRR